MYNFTVWIKGTLCEEAQYIVKYYVHLSYYYYAWNVFLPELPSKKAWSKGLLWMHSLFGNIIPGNRKKRQGKWQRIKGTINTRMCYWVGHHYGLLDPPESSWIPTKVHLRTIHQENKEGHFIYEFLSPITHEKHHRALTPMHLRAASIPIGGHRHGVRESCGGVRGECWAASLHSWTKPA